MEARRKAEVCVAVCPAGCDFASRTTTDSLSPAQAALRTTPPQSRSSSVATRRGGSTMEGLGGADSVASVGGQPRLSPVSGASTPPGGHLMAAVAEPDRAAALGAALVDIVRARNDRERVATAGGGGAFAHDLAGSGIVYRGGGSAPGGGNDAKALDAALTEQGKYRPTAEVLAAREAEWNATQGGSAAAAAMRRSLRGLGDGGPGGLDGGARGRGGAAYPDGSPSSIVPLGPVHRTAPPQAVESAGVSLVRALSGARLGGAGTAAAAAAAAAEAAVVPPASGSASPEDLDAGHAAAEAQAPVGVVASVAEPPLPCGGVPEAGPVVVVACTSRGDMHFIDARDGSSQRRVDIRVGDAQDPQHLQPGLTFCLAALASLGLVVTATDCVDVHGADASLLRAWPLRGDRDGQQAGHSVLTLPPQAGRVLALTSLDDRRLVAACSTGCLIVWTTLPAWSPAAQPGACAHDVICCSPAASSPLHALAPLPGAEVAAAGEDGVVRLWGTWDGGLEAELRGHSAGVTALEALEGGAVLVSADAGGSLRVWDLMTGECTRALRVATPGEVTSLWAAPSGLLLSASAHGTVALWRAQDGVSGATSAVPGGGVAAVHQLGGFHHALALCLDGRLRVLAARDGAPLLQLGDVTDITSVAVTGNAAPAGGHEARARCGPVRIRDRLWCFAGGARLC